MKNGTFTVIPQNMREYQMSVREADHENDLFREAFEAACKEDQVVEPRDVMLSSDFFKYGWEGAVKALNGDEDPAAQGESIDTPEFWRVVNDYDGRAVTARSIVEFIHEWGASQRQEGRRDAHETNVALVNENCALVEKLRALTGAKCEYPHCGCDNRASCSVKARALATPAPTAGEASAPELASRIADGYSSATIMTDADGVGGTVHLHYLTVAQADKAFEAITDAVELHIKATQGGKEVVGTKD